MLAVCCPFTLQFFFCIGEAVPVTVTLDLVGCWVCDLLETVQQSFTRVSLAAFNSLIKMAASASFLPYQFCLFFPSPLWVLHQLHLLPASPSSSISWHFRQWCWFPLYDSILSNETWVANSKSLEQHPWLPQQLYECCCSALKFSLYRRIVNANHILQWPSQLTGLAVGQCVLCWGTYGRRKSCAAGADPCMWTP